MHRIPLQPKTIDTNVITSPTKRSSPSKHSSPTKRQSPSKNTSPTKNRRNVKNDLQFEIYADPPGTKLPHFPVFNEEEKENGVVNGKENMKPGRLPLKDVNITQCKGYINGVALDVPWAVGVVPNYATPKRQRQLHLKEKNQDKEHIARQKEWEDTDRHWFEESDMDHVRVRPFNIWED
ncbi:hypothetical protein CANINC_004966 [Pichia inconspicua]|uniref:Uncharacterized protein n=1 Tax=Pichia inconspicua TaxID=52247 RepID=A0A4T0WV42_9ASCO|nr:hypothetical protein CANINC_004966 [[Candida] inconspicua]